MYLCLCELIPELLHLLPQLSDDPSIGILVHDSMVDDALGAVSIAQRRQGLVIVIGGRTHCGYHGGPTVTS